jgi:hypothetical protein
MSITMEKITKLLTQELTIVLMLGIISVITAWAGVQSSLHDGKSNKSLSVYMEGLGESNNMYLTSELKYRTDMVVWVDKQTILNRGGDINAGYSSGSTELFELAIPYLLENPESQLADCKSYMDKLYLPPQEALDNAIKSLHEHEVSNEYSDRLQMLTALLAVALFMLGITSVIRQEKLQFFIVIGAILIAAFSIATLLSIPFATVTW